MDGCHSTGVVWLGEPLAARLVPLVVTLVSHEHDIEVIRTVDDGQFDILIPVGAKRCCCLFRLPWLSDRVVAAHHEVDVGVVVCPPLSVGSKGELAAVDATL